MAGSACSGERAIKISTLISDSSTEIEVSETITLTADETDTTALTTIFTATTGVVVARVTVSGTNYSMGVFVLVRQNESDDGTVIDLNVLEGAQGERVGFVWTGANAPALQHNTLRTSAAPNAIDEEIDYRITLDTTA
jgi:hypothetical protein